MSTENVPTAAPVECLVRHSVADCPFCGGKAKSCSHANAPTDMGFSWCEGEAVGYCVCGECGAEASREVIRTGTSLPTQEQLDMAHYATVERWNRRVK